MGVKENKGSFHLMLDILNEGEGKIVLNKYENITLVLGNTGSGKSTLTQLIGGNDRELIAKEKGHDSGEYLIVDPNDRISNLTIVSKTIFPELVIDYGNANVGPFYDCPGFNDNRDTAHDIVTAYFINKVVDSAKAVKLVMTVSYPSVKSGVNRDDFLLLLKHMTTLVRDVDKFRNGIMLVATKVDNIYKNGKLVGDAKKIVGIAEFLKEVLSAIEARDGVKDVPISQHVFNRNAIKLIRILLHKNNSDHYDRIGIFRVPEEEGKLSDMIKFQEEKINIQNIIKNNINFIPKYKSDFGYTISVQSKNDLYGIAKEIDSYIMELTFEVGKEIQDHYARREKNIVDLYKLRDELMSAHNGFRELKLRLGDITTIPQYLDLLTKHLNDLNIHNSKDTLLKILRQGRYINFLQIVSGRNLETDPLKWFTGFTQTIEFQKDSLNWYSFLINLYTRLSEYDVQSNTTRYKINSFQNELGTAQFIKVNETSLNQFVLNLGENWGLEISGFNDIKNIYVDKNKLALLDDIIIATLKNEIQVELKEKEMVIEVTGTFVKLSDVVNNTICNGDKMSLRIFASNKIFIDKDLSHNGDISLIAPEWKVVGQRKITSYGKSCKKNHEKIKADNSYWLWKNGDDGNPGMPGESSGKIFGIVDTIIDENNLRVVSEGGKGCPGQNGGDGAVGMDGINAPVFEKIFFREHFEAYCDKWKGLSWAHIMNIKYDGQFSGCTFQFLNLDYIDDNDKIELWRIICNGSNGETGSNGGNGGVGGVGGSANEIKINKFQGREFKNLELQDGLPGENGKGGGGGKGGNNGNGSIVYLKTWQGKGTPVNICEPKIVFKWGVKITNILSFGLLKQIRKLIHQYYCVNSDTINTFIANPAFAIDGINGVDGGNYDGLKVPYSMSHERIDFVINSYKSFLTNLTMNYVQKKNALHFLTNLDSNKSIRSSYDILGLINELQSLEKRYKFINSENILPFYESLMEKIKTQIQNSNSLSERKVLSYVYTSALSKINNIVYGLENNLIIDLRYDLESTLKNVTKMKNMRNNDWLIEFKPKYEEMIENKTVESHNLIIAYVLPEIENMINETNNTVINLFNEMIEFENKSLNETEMPTEILLELEWGISIRTILNSLKFTSQLLSFLGPIGVSINRFVSNGIPIDESFVLDSPIVPVKTLFQLSEEVNYMFKHKIVKDQMNIDKFRRVNDYKILLEDIINEISYTSSCTSLYSVCKNILDAQKLLDDSEGTEFEIDNYDLIEQTLNKLFIQIKDMENKFITENISRLKFTDVNQMSYDDNPTEDITIKNNYMAINLIDSNQDKTHTKNMSLINAVKNINEIVKISELLGIDLYTEIRNNMDKLNLATRIITEKSIKLNQIKLNVDTLNNLVVGMNVNIKKHLNEVNEKSASNLEVKKWNVRSILKDTRLQIKQITSEFRVNNSLMECIEKIDEFLSIMTGIFKHLENYKQHKEFEAHVLNIYSNHSTSIQINDVNLINAVNHFNTIIRENIVLGHYEQILTVFKQYVYPFSDIQSHEIEVNVNESVIDHTINKLKQLQSFFGKNLSDLSESYVGLKSAEFTSQSGHLGPFYVWKNVDYYESIRNLLIGQAIILRADVLNGLSKNAVKFGKIRINFITAVNAARQNMENDLKAFNVSMTHLGNSYYRCGKRFYVIRSNRREIEYSLDEDDRTGKSIAGNEDIPTLSPYAMWKIQLTNANGEGFDVLHKYKRLVDLELVGRGSYVEENAKVCEDDLENPYEVDETISETNVVLNEMGVDVYNHKLQLVENPTQDRKLSRRHVVVSNEDNDDIIIAGDNRPKVVDQTSSSTNYGNRMFDWINNAFSQHFNGRNKTFVDTPSLWDSAGANRSTIELNPVDNINVNYTLTLIDFLVRNVTKTKPYNAKVYDLDSTEVQAYSLNILTDFERLLDEFQKRKNVSTKTHYDYNPLDLNEKIIKEIMNGNFAKLSDILYKFVEKNISDNNDGFWLRKKITKMLNKYNV